MNRRQRSFHLASAAALGIFSGAAFAQPEPARADPNQLKRLDLEQLLEMEVVTPSRRAAPWFYAPTAIEVLSDTDIRRYGANTIPDTLRLAPGLHVARYIGNGYAISARGFSSAAGNKLEVLMDGRSLYTPLFSGVFWETQDTLLEDIAQIEVIRGPGAALWGANAINGVISITTKSARDTQGTLITGGGGNEDIGFGGIRYGGQAGESTFWRVYSKYRYRDEQKLSTGADAEDFSEHWQSGFRVDSYLAEVNHLTFQGDYYLNDFGQFGRADAHAQGANFISRWTRTFSEDSDLQVQAYYDRMERDVPIQYAETRDSFDLDLQHSFAIGERNALTWGGNYHWTTDTTAADRVYVFSPRDRSIDVVSGFVQDAITIVPDHLTLTLGAKVEHNDFTGFEAQPSARVAFTPTRDHVIWAGVSRAVRRPTRIETDVRLRTAPGSPVFGIVGNPNFESEDVIAYELGYRTRLTSNTSFEVSTFYNVYDNLRTIQFVPGSPLTLMNERAGDTYGFETVFRYEPREFWRLTASYTLLKEDLDFKAGAIDPTGGRTEANDPAHMARLRSHFSLPHNIDFDQMLRFVDELPNPRVEPYVELDLRVAWRPKDNLEFSIVGMNLLDNAHPEFAGSGFQTEVERSVYAKVLWMF